MKVKLLLASVIMLFFGEANAQTQYEISPDPEQPQHKMLRGIITKDLLKNDTAFAWYASSEKGYSASDTSITGPLQRNNSINYIVFGGTWCEDTQTILPKFFKLQEKAGIADNRITFFAVDRQKKTISNLASALNITNVPTIIVMKNGKELGRVVEYGKTGKWDKELAGIVTQ